MVKLFIANLKFGCTLAFNRLLWPALRRLYYGFAAYEMIVSVLMEYALTIAYWE